MEHISKKSTSKLTSSQEIQEESRMITSQGAGKRVTTPLPESGQVSIDQRKVQTPQQNKVAIFENFFNNFFAFEEDKEKEEKKFVDLFGVKIEDFKSLMMGEVLDANKVQNFLDNIDKIYAGMNKLLREAKANRLHIHSFVDELTSILESSKYLNEEKLDELKNQFEYQWSMVLLEDEELKLKKETNKIFPTAPDLVTPSEVKEKVSSRRGVKATGVTHSDRGDMSFDTKVVKKPISETSTSKEKLEAAAKLPTSGLGIKGIMEAAELMRSINDADLNADEKSLFNNLKKYIVDYTKTLCANRRNPSFYEGLKLQKTYFPDIYKETLKEKHTLDYEYITTPEYFSILQERINLGLTSFDKIQRIVINCKGMKREETMQLSQFLKDNADKLVNLQSIQITGPIYDKVTLPQLKSLKEIDFEVIYGDVVVPTLPSLERVQIGKAEGVSIATQPELREIVINEAKEVFFPLLQHTDQKIEIPNVKELSMVCNKMDNETKTFFEYLNKNPDKFANLEYLQITGTYKGDVIIPQLKSLNEIHFESINGNVNVPKNSSVKWLNIGAVNEVSIDSQTQLEEIKIKNAKKLTIQLPQYEGLKIEVPSMEILNFIGADGNSISNEEAQKDHKIEIIIVEIKEAESKPISEGIQTGKELPVTKKSEIKVEEVKVEETKIEKAKTSSTSYMLWSGFAAGISAILLYFLAIILNSSSEK